MNNYIASITIENSGSKVFQPKINKKVDYKDVSSEDFKRRYKDCLFVEAEDKNKALNKAKILLKRYKDMICHFKEENKDLIGGI